MACKENVIECRTNNKAELVKKSKQLVRSKSLLSSRMMVRLQQQTQNRTKYIRFANSLHKDSHTICYYVVCYKGHFLMKVVYTDWFQPSGSDLQLGQPNLKLTVTQWPFS